ncbi:protein Sso2p [Trichomonascus vanleenenianus]|uniref:syntaxin n=1 Tax=Trichomonascus vanleenenianus TaxID=2268995 RepID=UPI003EC9CB30
MSYNNTGYNQYGNAQYGNPYGDNSYEMTGNVGAQGNDDMMMFFREIDDIKKSLVQYDDNVDRIEGLHKRSLTEVAGGEGEQWTQKNIDELVGQTSQLANSLKQRIKSLESRSMQDPTKKAQVENAKNQFKTSIQKYQAVEQQFRQRYREAAERQFRIVKPDATEEEVREAVDNTESQVFAQALMSTNRRGQARTALAEVQNRHREIEKIEKTMSELAQLFHDMEVLVAEQDVAITHIDEQAQEVQHDIEQGVGHTTRAVFSARAARKKKLWCLLIIIICVIVLALVLGIHFGTK